MFTAVGLPGDRVVAAVAFIEVGGQPGRRKAQGFWPALGSHCHWGPLLGHQGTLSRGSTYEGGGLAQSHMACWPGRSKVQCLSHRNSPSPHKCPSLGHPPTATKRQNPVSPWGPHSHTVLFPLSKGKRAQGSHLPRPHFYRGKLRHWRTEGLLRVPAQAGLSQVRTLVY